MYEIHRNEEVAVQSDWLCTATNKGYLTSFKKTTNPNVSPIGKRFGFECFGADDRTRTCTLARWNLNPMSLPIPPHPRIQLTIDNGQLSIFVPLIFTRGGTRGGAFRLLHDL